MSTTTTNTLKIDATLLASLRAQKAQCSALVLALQDYVDAPGKDTVKEKRKSAACRIGKDVLKRKNALSAKTPGELRVYVESIKQKSQSLMGQLPTANWLLEHCTKELIRVTLAQIVELCNTFVAEYNEAKSEAEKKQPVAQVAAK